MPRHSLSRRGGFLAILFIALMHQSSVHAQTPSDVLHREPAGQLVLDGWKEVVGEYERLRQERSRKLWIFLDGRIVRKLPFDAVDSRRSNSLNLSNGTHKLEVLELDADPGSVAMWRGTCVGSVGGIIWSQSLSVKGGATLRESMIQTLVSLGSKQYGVHLEQPFTVWEGVHSCGIGQRLYRGPGVVLIEELRLGREVAAMRLVRGQKELDEYRKALDDRLSEVGSAPAVSALLRTAALLDQEPPSTRTIVVDFPERVGGPREVDADLVRRCLSWTLKSIGEAPTYVFLSTDPNEAILNQYRRVFQERIEAIRRTIIGMAEKLDKAPPQ